MVDIQVPLPEESTIDKISDIDLEEFNKILEDIPKQIDSFPEPPKELLEKMTDKEKLKVEKARSKWATKLQARYNTTRIQKILGLKQAYQKTQSEIEKDFIYKPGFLEKLGQKILGRNYLRIMIIMPTGVLKEFNKPIKTNYIKVMQGRYVIQLSAMIKFKGKNTLFYHYGNPFPITFDSDKFPYIVSSESLENMFNSNIVGQIFAGLSMGKAMMYTFGMFAGIATIIAAVLMFGPAAIKDSTSPVLLLFSARWLKLQLKK